MFFADLYSFQRLAGLDPAGGGRVDSPSSLIAAKVGVPAFAIMLNAALPSPFRRKETAWASTPSPAPPFAPLTARKDGPSLYDVCDPVLLKYRGGDPHLGKFYRTALGNPALRPLLRRTGLPALRDEEPPAGAAGGADRRARDEAEPDWAAVGAPIAELMADIEVRHPSPPPAAAPAGRPIGREIERVIRRCGAHLLRLV